MITFSVCMASSFCTASSLREIFSKGLLGIRQMSSFSKHPPRNLLKDTVHECLISTTWQPCLLLCSYVDEGIGATALAPGLPDLGRHLVFS